MYDCYNRQINYLRISITDRCNLRCLYCMPEEGIPLISHDRIMHYEEIATVVREAVDLGIDKVRITGGEPLVRKGVEKLVAMIAAIPGIRDFGLTTNGILLERFAPVLKEAGLHRVNISLDAVNPVRYRELTRGGDVDQVIHGIEAAKRAGLTPVKINCVVQQSSEEKDAREVQEFCQLNDLEIRFIHQMSLEHGCFTTVEGGDGGDCSRCSRLRLTAEGKIKPCLFNDLGFDIRELGIRQALLLAIQNKPEKGSVNTINSFQNIGG
ncbi:MAG: radical SAM protein [Bacteroidetes bacterium]|nr:MAG: radical SAM protein [Bacteroidota bacterium]